MNHLWGTSETMFSSHGAVLVEFDAEAGGASSLHYHSRLNNLVAVTTGVVEIYSPGGPLWRRLEAGEMGMVPAGVPHQLRFPSDSTGYELYTPTAGGSASVGTDIVRSGTGKIGSRRRQQQVDKVDDNREYAREWYRKNKRKK